MSNDFETNSQIYLKDQDTNNRGWLRNKPSNKNFNKNLQINKKYIPENNYLKQSDINKPFIDEDNCFICGIRKRDFPKDRFYI